MTARILDGKGLAETIRAEVRAGVDAFRARHGRAPGLDVVLVGDDPGERRLHAQQGEGLERGRHPRAAPPPRRVHVGRRARRAPATRSTPTRQVDGILVQLPLPAPHRRRSGCSIASTPPRTSTAFTPSTRGSSRSGAPARSSRARRPGACVSSRCRGEARGGQRRRRRSQHHRRPADGAAPARARTRR